MHRITLQIRPDQYKHLKALSVPGVSISSLVRQALDEFFKKQS